MNIVDKALETQLKNIQTRTGKTLDELYALIRTSGLTKHGEILELLKRDLGMGHGDANRVALAFQSPMVNALPKLPRQRPMMS